MSDVSKSHPSLRTKDLDYELPQHLIAMHPVEPRDSARMLVMWRSESRIEHRIVRDLPGFLVSGDALVFNTTAVVPARLLGHRAGSGGRVEGLFLREVSVQGGRPQWEAMLRAGGRLQPGDRIELHGIDDRPSGCFLELAARDQDRWLAELHGMDTTQGALERLGRTPLPPYILKARGDRARYADQADRNWYQTVYADSQKRESIAAPTAGMHFTPQLLQNLEQAGVRRIDVTLHVGAGTFKPVTAESLDQHRMHAESYEVTAQAIAALRTEAIGSRTIAVGTTSVRTLESLPAPLPDPAQMCGPVRGMTDLMIAPPYQFKHVDGMLTNFHLPRSTLLALVAAMVGLDRLKAIYREAIAHSYRFYSYGDAMLILP
jgi:S-adenosylmethionine:tRNA ribosyltransferase-isomerase